jgi:hypothetical protein
MTVTTKPRSDRMSLASDASLEQAIGKIVLHLAEQCCDWGRDCSIGDPQIDSILDRRGSATEFLRELGAMAAIDPKKAIGIAAQINALEAEQTASLDYPVDFGPPWRPGEPLPKR